MEPVGHEQYVICKEKGHVVGPFTGLELRSMLEHGAIDSKTVVRSLDSRKRLRVEDVPVPGMTAYYRATPVLRPPSPFRTLAWLCAVGTCIAWAVLARFWRIDVITPLTNLVLILATLLAFLWPVGVWCGLQAKGEGDDGWLAPTIVNSVGILITAVLGLGIGL